jgi:hypothetical protein
MLRQALKVFSTFNPPPLASLPSDPRPNQLHGLPTELLQYIASMFLPLSSAASLALSSRFILTKLGTNYFTQLKKASPLPPVTRCYGTNELGGPNGPAPRLTLPEQELENFLILLDRDIRDTIYCYYCRTIHDPMKTLYSCTECERQVAIHNHLHSNLAFSRFQIIMKRSRFGIDYSALLRKLSTTCTRYYISTLFTHQITTYARIVSGCLLLRTVQWWLFKWELDCNWPRYSIKICHHLRPEDRDPRPAFIAVERPGAYGKTSIYRRGAGIELKRCHVCGTEYEIDGAECGPGLFALRVSTWQDFGDCSSGYFGHPKCKHSRKHLGSSTQSTASPPWNIKSEFEDSCSGDQKLGTRLELPKGLHPARWKWWRKNYSHYLYPNYYSYYYSYYRYYS